MWNQLQITPQSAYEKRFRGEIFSLDMSHQSEKIWCQGFDFLPEQEQEQEQEL